MNRVTQRAGVKIHEIVKTVPDASVFPMSPLDPGIAIWFYFIINLPRVHIVRLVEVDIN